MMMILSLLYLLKQQLLTKEAETQNHIDHQRFNAKVKLQGY